MNRNTPAGPSSTRESDKSVRQMTIALRALGITLLSFGMSLLLASPLSFSVMSMFSSPQKDDTDISDFYTQVADLRPVRHLESDIVIVDIGSAGREEIAEALEILSVSGPKAVGLDIIFEDPREGDERLLNAVASIPELVLPVVAETDSSGSMVPVMKSYFSDFIGRPAGVVNLVSRHEAGTVREFAVSFPSENDSRLESFPVEIVKVSYPDRIPALKNRGNSHEFIDYPSKEFDIIPIAELGSRTGELTGKIVLVGSISDASDIHPTPLDARLSGLLIHAYSVNTILNGDYYDRPSKLGDWVIAFLLTIFTVWASIVIDIRVKGLVVRLLQLLIVYLAVQIGYYLFVDHKIIFNFSYTLLMIAFGMFASDLWNGTKGLAKLIIERRTRRREEKEKAIN